ncbi:M16 family metallopeptidase [Sphingomonas aerophila]|uniref:Zinc protease n=1 Tax=Sphingomonas aerophila TaxID=1344948 RepID=A0A7W9BEH7_9SPHN|nr:M16 family metallopeptidase [Sphingomonas aerophila]MBB5715722.1 zinc protease [Sphingomonas aerophila]
MPFSSRALRFVLLLPLLAQPLAAQRVAPAAPARATAAAPVAIDRTPWLYKGSDITPDPAWQFGTLPNGVRLAVRRNGVPPGQVAIRVRVDAGSLFEKDSERGFAHFIEHLTFRGSQFVPDGEAKRIWQRMGTTFGSDTNASTTPTQTVYKLDLPGATEANVGESLKILSGMIAAPAIIPAAVNAERPVVLAERREQPGPQVRIGDLIRGTFFAGQPLADRSPIGTVETLTAGTADTIRAFHDRWYRPERTTVIISGDMDPEVAMRLVAQHFSGWKGIGTAPAEPDFGKPDPSKPVSATLVEPGVPVLVAMSVLRPWHFNNDTVIFNQKRLVDTLATRLISRRLEQRARAGGSFLQAGVDLDDVSRSANVTSVNVVPVGDDWEAALRDVRAVIADAMASPPSQAEVDREYADYDTAMRTGVETARVEAGAKQADDMAQALDIRETTTSPQTSYEILKDARAKGMFTPETLLASTRRIFQGDATRVVANLHAADPAAPAKLAAALKADVSGLAGKRRAQAAVTFDKLPALGRPATVTAREKIAQLEMEQVTFSNGVRLLMYPNASESGRVYVRVRFGGGWNAVPADRTTPAWSGELALVASGIGSLNQGDLDQLTAGRRLGLDFDMGDDALSLGAITSPADYPDELRLIAAKLQAPAWDPAPVARAKAVALAGYSGLEASPDGVLSRDLEGLLRADDPRWKTPSREDVNKLTPAEFKRFWAPRLASGPIEVSIFGEVKPDDAIAAVARTLGTLPPRKGATGPAAPVRFPAHNARPVIRTHSGPDTQAAAVIAWPTGSGVTAIAESRRLDVLAQVFSDRLFERLRNEAGASYSPSVASQWPLGLTGGGRLVAIGQLSPDKVDFFFRLSREIAADLAARPVGEDELRRVLVPMGQQFLRASTGNLFWLRQLSGATFDPRLYDATRSYPSDLVAVTPAILQETARKYLRPDTDWTMAVLPRDKGSATAPSSAR